MYLTYPIYNPVHNHGDRPGSGRYLGKSGGPCPHAEIPSGYIKMFDHSRPP